MREIALSATTEAQVIEVDGKQYLRFPDKTTVNGKPCFGVRVGGPIEFLYEQPLMVKEFHAVEIKAID